MQATITKPIHSGARAIMSATVTPTRVRDVLRRSPVAVSERVSASTVDAADRSRQYLELRTCIDQAVGALFLIVAAPLLLAIAALVRLTSSGPVIYTQVRSGRDGLPFVIYKFRSMTVDAERHTGAAWSGMHDPRVTRIGAWLRWSHLDELPQLFNIARGDMTLIGPRPERPEIVAKLIAQIPGYEKRLAMAPGLTGLAQVSLPADTGLSSVRRKLILDVQYLQSASLAMDVHILLCTGLLVFGVRRALEPRFWVELDN